MGLVGNLASKAAGAAAKAAAKKVGKVAETAVIVKAGEAIENKAKSRHAELMADEFGDRKLMVLRDLKSAGGRWEIYDDDGDYTYVAIGSLASATPKVVFYSPEGEELGSFRKKVVSIRSPFDQTQGDNFDYEITVAGRKLGLFRNKTIGTVFDPFAAFHSEPGFTTLCYEFDYNSRSRVQKVKDAASERSLFG